MGVRGWEVGVVTGAGEWLKNKKFGILSHNITLIWMESRTTWCMKASYYFKKPI